MTSEQILADWLERRDDPLAIAALVDACERDPQLAVQARRLAAIDEHLSLQLAPERADFPNRLRQALTHERFAAQVSRQMRGRRRERWLWVAVLAQAAALIALFAVPWLQTPTTRGPYLQMVAGEGFYLRLGENARVDRELPLQSGDRVHLQPGASADLVLGPASRIRCSDSADLVLLPAGHGLVEPYLALGSIDADIAQRDLQGPLFLSTPHCRIQVTGTRFTVRADERQSEVAVSHGRVQVQDLLDGTTAAVASGQQRISVPASGMTATTIRTMKDALGQTTSLREAGCESGSVMLTDRMQQGRNESLLYFGGNWAYVVQRLSQAQDWSRYLGLSLLFNGQGGGVVHQVEVVSGSTQFVANVRDQQEGWHTLFVPWSAFHYRIPQHGDIPLPAELPPFRPTGVVGFGIIFSGPSTSGIAIGDWGLIDREQP